MHGLMMDYELTLLPIFERVGKYFPDVEIVSRWPDKSIHRSTYGEFHKRVQQLANALVRLGLKPGDRVATLGWNHGRHLEAYFAIPLAGGVISRQWIRPAFSSSRVCRVRRRNVSFASRTPSMVDVTMPIWPG